MYKHSFPNQPSSIHVCISTHIRILRPIDIIHRPTRVNIKKLNQCFPILAHFGMTIRLDKTVFIEKFTSFSPTEIGPFSLCDGLSTLNLYQLSHTIAPRLRGVNASE